MSWWITAKNNTETEFSCKTAACIGGWAVILGTRKKTIPIEPVFPGHRYYQKNFYVVRNDFLRTTAGMSSTTGTSALILLGLDPKHAHRVFEVDCWPSPFRERFQKARTRSQKARVAADYINWIIGEES